MTESWSLRRLKQTSLFRLYNQQDTALKEDPGGHLGVFGESLSKSSTPTKVTTRGQRQPIPEFCVFSSFPNVFLAAAAA